MPDRYLGFEWEAEGIRRALATAAKAARGHAVWLLVPSLSQLRGSTLREALGDRVADALAKNQPVRVREFDVVLRRILMSSGRSKRKMMMRFETSPDDAILVVYATQEMFDVLDDLRVAAVMAVAAGGWEEDALQWAGTWQPHMLDDEIATVPGVELDPVVVEGLKRITSANNLEHRSIHAGPYERATAQLLKELHQAGYPLPPNDIRAWAQRNGWNPSLAGDLEAMARKIADGRRVRGTGGRRAWQRGIVAYLERKAADKDH